jgi:hypothetical protein
MTNREVLNTPKKVLGALDRQRQLLLQLVLLAQPCPACERPLNVLDAAGLDIDRYDCDGADEPPFHCPGCGAVLERSLPLFAHGGPPWSWRLDSEWPRARLEGTTRPPGEAPHTERTSDGP